MVLCHSKTLVSEGLEGGHRHPVNYLQWRPQNLREGVLRHSYVKHARKICTHAPKTLTIPLIERVLEGSWLTKKAVLGQN